MKTLTFQISTLVKSARLVVILSGFGFAGLHAQNEPTDIVPAGATVTKLSSGQYKFLEGPVWYNDSVLLFVDDAIGSPNIFQYNPVGNQFSKWPSNAMHCVGLSCDKDGNLIGASSNIIMMNKAGQVIKTLASGYNGKPFDNPNDLIADNKGGVYFTDPDYFLTTPPQDKTAIYYIESTGNVKRVADDLDKPNGLVLSPDGTKLYAVDESNKYVYSWNVATDGSVSGKLTLAELQTTGGVKAGADGMAIDINGNIYVASEKGIQVFSSSGFPVATIVIPEIPSNCDFGGRDFKTLYITAHTSDFQQSNLYSIDLNFPGYAVSRKGIFTGVNSSPIKQLVELYPNPVLNELHVNLSREKGMLELFDISGKNLLSKEIHEGNTILDFSGLVNGIYLVKVSIGKEVITDKIVKY